MPAHCSPGYSRIIVWTWLSSVATAGKQSLRNGKCVRHVARLSSVGSRFQPSLTGDGNESPNRQWCYWPARHPWSCSGNPNSRVPVNSKRVLGVRWPFPTDTGSDVNRHSLYTVNNNSKNSYTSPGTTVKYTMGLEQYDVTAVADVSDGPAQFRGDELRVDTQSASPA